MDLKEKIINEKLMYKGNYLNVVNVDVILPNGKKNNRDIIKHPGATAIIPFIDEKNIVLVEQFRVPIGQNILELPAGKVNNDEDLALCAKRELQEETGYTAGNMEYLGKIAVAPGYCNEFLHLYKATDLTLGEKNEDEDEFTNVKIIEIDEIKKMIRNGEIIDSKITSILAYL